MDKITPNAVFYNSSNGIKKVSFCKNADPEVAPDGYQLTEPEKDARDVAKSKIIALRENTQAYINELCLPYCDAEQKTWPSILVPLAESWLDDNSIETTFLDKWVNGMLVDNESRIFEDTKLNLAIAIKNNDVDYRELLSLILGVTTSRRDRVNTIIEDTIMTNLEKVNAIESINSDVGTFIYEYLESVQEGE